MFYIYLQLCKLYVFKSKIIHQRLRQMLKVNFLPHGPMQSLQFFRGPVPVPILIQIPIQIPPPPPRDGHSFVLLFFNRRARWAVVSVREGFSMSFLALVSPSGMNKILWGNLSDGEQVEFRDAFNRAYHDHDYQFMNQRQLKIQGPFIWSQVFKTTLPSSFPGRANFWLISLDNSTNRLPETGVLVSGAGQLDRECCPASARHRFLAYTLRLAWGTTRDRVFWVREETDEGTAVTTHNSR